MGLSFVPTMSPLVSCLKPLTPSPLPMRLLPSLVFVPFTVPKLFAMSSANLFLSSLPAIMLLEILAIPKLAIPPPAKTSGRLLLFSAVLSVIVLLVIVTVPNEELWGLIVFANPPPVSDAVLPLRVLLINSRFVSLRIAPPFLAVLPLKVLLIIVADSPVLINPPPPLVGLVPMEVLSAIVLSIIVIVPLLRIPPPSSAAWLSRTTTFFRVRFPSL